MRYALTVAVLLGLAACQTPVGTGGTTPTPSTPSDVVKLACGYVVPLSKILELLSADPALQTAEEAGQMICAGLLATATATRYGGTRVVIIKGVRITAKRA